MSVKNLWKPWYHWVSATVILYIILQIKKGFFPSEKKPFFLLIILPVLPFCERKHCQGIRIGIKIYLKFNFKGDWFVALCLPRGTRHNQPLCCWLVVGHKSKCLRPLDLFGTYPSYWNNKSVTRSFCLSPFNLSM